jgi:uncharacterized protein (DUF58 family)
MNNDSRYDSEPTVFNSFVTFIIVAFLLFIALLYRQGNLVLLSLLVLCLVIGTKTWTRFSLSRVTCVISVDKQRAFPGEILKLKTILENAKFLPVWLRIQWPIGSALQPVESDGAILRQETGLLWHQRVQLQLDLVAQRRGVHRIDPPRILSGDFLGFFEKEKSLPDPGHVVVYPRLIPLEPLCLPKRNFFGVPGAKSPVQDPIYILGTRDYQPSRPARFIHWKASARHLRLQEKIFEPSQQEKVLLAMDVGSFEESKDKEAFEQTLEVVASMAVQLDNLGCAVGLATNGIMTDRVSSAVPITRSHRQISVILEALARLQMVQKEKMKESMRNITDPLHQVSCAFFAYDDGKTADEVAQYCQTQNLEATFWVCHTDPDTGMFQKKNGLAVQPLDEIRTRRRNQA